jgi:polyhydroxyalkanoate synthesis regulator phasin
VPGEEKFTKYQAAGADFLEEARARAEELLSELARLSDSTQRQAQVAIEELIEGSRRGSEQIVSAIGAEVASQLSALGVATRRELDDIERRLTDWFSPGRSHPPQPVPPAALISGEGPEIPPEPAAAPAATRPTGPAREPAKKAGRKAAGKKAPGEKPDDQQAHGQTPVTAQGPDSDKRPNPSKKGAPKKAPANRASAKKAAGEA